MLSKAVWDELKSELDHLRAERQRTLSRYDAKIEAIEAILSDAPPAQASLPLDDGARAGSNGGGSGLGFREMFLGMVKAYPGLRAAEIASRIESSGYRLGGGSSILARVHGEGYRLHKAQRLHRRGGKYYPVVEKDKVEKVVQ